MNSTGLLSLLVSIAMLFSGCYSTDQPEALSARTMTISNVSVAYNDTAVTLNPSASIGVMTQNNAAILDFSMACGDETLFPMQLEMREDGLKLLFTESGKAYTIDSDALEEMIELMGNQLTATFTAEITPPTVPDINVGADENALEPSVDEPSEVPNAPLPDETEDVPAEESVLPHASGAAPMANFSRPNMNAYTVDFSLPNVSGNAPAEESASPDETEDGPAGSADTEALDPFSASILPPNQGFQNFMMERYIPAYLNLLKAIQHPDFDARVLAANEEFDAKIDRGEGVPGKAEHNGVEYDVSTYAYTLDSSQMCALVDETYNSINEEVSDFYAMFFEYVSLISDANVHSFKDLMTLTHMDMHADVQENISQDGEYRDLDMVMTFSMPNMDPFVFNYEGWQLGSESEVTMTCDYAYEGMGMEIDAQADYDGSSATTSMSMDLFEEDVKIGSFNIEEIIETDPETGEKHYRMGVNAGDDDIAFDCSLEGTVQASGDSENTFELSVAAYGDTISFAFDADISTEPFENQVTGADSTEITYEMLTSEDSEAMSALSGDILEIAGSFVNDVQVLVEDESINELINVFSNNALLNTDEDTSYDSDYDYSDYDDGELPFDEPEFTYLPEGYQIVQTDIDTLYDSVSVIITDASEENSIDAYFTCNYMEGNAETYAVNADGEMTAFEDRLITIEQDGDDYYYVDLNDGNVSVSLVIFADDIDLETIGKIVAGLKF